MHVAQIEGGKILGFIHSTTPSQDLARPNRRSPTAGERIILQHQRHPSAQSADCQTKPLRTTRCRDEKDIILLPSSCFQAACSIRLLLLPAFALRPCVIAGQASCQPETAWWMRACATSLGPHSGGLPILGAFGVVVFPLIDPNGY